VEIGERKIMVAWSILSFQIMTKLLKELKEIMIESFMGIKYCKRGSQMEGKD